ncbi:MAG TPA: hypothetical protein VF213_15260, partial [Dongiaceae bacterium]
MAQDVADSGDLAPRDIRFCCLQAVRDPTACLGDDFEIALNQLTNTPVGNEPLEVQSGGISLDVGDRLENVVSLEPGIALRRHQKTVSASARMLSRILGLRDSLSTTSTGL